MLLFFKDLLIVGSVGDLVLLDLLSNLLLGLLNRSRDGVERLPDVVSQHFLLLFGFACLVVSDDVSQVLLLPLE